MVAQLYKYVRTYLRTCETCKRIKPLYHPAAPLNNFTHTLKVLAIYWLDFVSTLRKIRTVTQALKSLLNIQARWIILRICQIPLMEKMNVICLSIACFVKTVWRRQVSLIAICASWGLLKSVSTLMGIRLDIFSSNHPHTDNQNERVNCVTDDFTQYLCWYPLTL